MVHEEYNVLQNTFWDVLLLENNQQLVTVTVIIYHSMSCHVSLPIKGALEVPPLGL